MQSGSLKEKNEEMKVNEGGINCVLEEQRKCYYLFFNLWKSWFNVFNLFIYTM